MVSLSKVAAKHQNSVMSSIEMLLTLVVSCMFRISSTMFDTLQCSSCIINIINLFKTMNTESVLHLGVKMWGNHNNIKEQGWVSVHASLYFICTVFTVYLDLIPSIWATIISNICMISLRSLFSNQKKMTRMEIITANNFNKCAMSVKFKKYLMSNNTRVKNFMQFLNEAKCGIKKRLNQMNKWVLY